MRILFVLENYYPNIGGVETLFKYLVEQLAQNGHEVIIVTTQLEKSHPRKELLDNISIIRYPFKNRYFFTFFAVFPILKIIRQVDLVHTTSYNAGLPAFFAAKLFRKKVVITFHEMWGDLWFQLPFMSKVGKWLHYLFEQFLVRLPFDKFIAVSESTAMNLKKAGVAKKKVIVNYNGIDYNDFQTQEDLTKPLNNPFVYTYFGRIGVSKGIDLLLEAASQIKDELPQAQLKLIIPTSPAPFFQDIEQLIRDYELENHTILMHELSFDKLKREIQQSSCVVIPSYSEGFCFVAVETMAMGVPIISSNQTALKEVVGGKHINMEAMTSKALVKAIQKAAKGEWNEKPLRRFELKDTVNRYLELYKNL